MVKTRAQREQGFVTPSPKTVDQGQVKNQGTSRRRNDATQKSRNGTEVKSSNKRQVVLSKRQDMMITNTPRSTRNTKMPRRKSPNTNKSKEKRQKTPAKQAGRVDKEDDNNEDEDDGEGCHGDLQSDDDAIQQKADMKSRKSVRKQRKGHNVREVEETAITEPALEEEDDDEAMESEENEGQEEEEEEEMEELQEGEEEEKEDSESKSDALDTDDASLHQKPQTTEGGFMTSIAKEIDAESDDDAPQDISFSASRQEALDSISQALQQTKRTEERAKEKRRNRDKLLKLQKERKKISLEHSRLPEDFLSEVARTPDGQLLEQSVVASTHQRTRKEQQHHKIFDSDGEMDFDEGDDYIPLSSDEPKVVEGFEVHAISRQKRAPPPKSDMALDFLQQQLYGAKIKRESVIKHKARLLKRQGKPSLVFQNPKEKRRKHKHQGSSKATGVRQ